MATTYTESIGSGRDHANIAAWEAATDNNLVSLDEVRIGQVYDALDEHGVTISGATTDATRYRQLESHSSARHDGTEGSYAGMHPTGSSLSPAYFLTISEANFDLGWLEFNGAGVTSWTSAALYGVVHGSGSDNLKVHHMIIRDLTSASGNACSAIYTNDTAVNWDIYRNIIYNITGTSGTGTGIHMGFYAVGTTTIDCYNNTVYNVNTRGIDVSANDSSCTINCENNISMGSGSVDYRFDDQNYGQGAGTINEDVNMASDATASPVTPNPCGSCSGTTHYDNETASSIFTNVSAGSEDFHLKSGTNAVDNGNNQGSPYDTDIDGTSVTGSWDLGADEYVSAGPSIAILAYHYNHNVGSNL